MPTSDVVGKPTTVNMQEVPGTPGLCNDLHELSTELIERIEGSRFGIQYTVLISGSGRSWDSCSSAGQKARKSDRAAVEAAIEETFELCDASINEWNAASDASRLNGFTGGVSFDLSRPLREVLSTSAIAHAALPGRFDPTIAPLSGAWSAALDAGGTLPAARVDELRRITGWDQLGFDAATATCTKAHAGVSVDLGGVSKGWVVDELLSRLVECGDGRGCGVDEGCDGDDDGSNGSGGNGSDGSKASLGFEGALCAWGGDVRAFGEHPGRRGGWRVSLERPPPLEALHARFEAAESAKRRARGDGGGGGGRRRRGGGGQGSGGGHRLGNDASALAFGSDGRHSELDLAELPAQAPRGMSIAVSGDAERARKFGLHHIIDPSSGALLRCGQLAPALVAVEDSESCALADALATALMTAPSVADARLWLVSSARDGRLPPSVRRVHAYCRSSDVLVSFEPHTEARWEETSAELRRAMREVPAPVAVISCAAGPDGGSHPDLAVTANSVVSCSMAPPLISFNLKRGSAAARAIAPELDATDEQAGRSPKAAAAAAAATTTQLVAPTPGALTHLSVCFAGRADEVAARRYAEPRPMTDDERATASAMWWDVARAARSRCNDREGAVGDTWRCLRGAVASLRCEVRGVLRTGSSLTVIAEVVDVMSTRAGEEGEGGGPRQPARSALLYQAGKGLTRRGYFGVAVGDN